MSETTNTTADINLPSLEKEGADERKVIIVEKKPRAQTCRERKPVKIERPKSSKSTGDLSDSKDPFAYRHFHTFFPSCNRLLAKKWEDRAKSMHLQKLHEAKPTIDNTPPKIYPHLEIRLKKLKLEEDRMEDIERKNHILLKRIADQMSKNGDKKPANRNSTERNCQSSLSGDKRRRDQILIATQNAVRVT
ncbi:hypothetical protein HDV04_003336 [Boothiomyces sp. JEL0838]|nr:hypothetical protein HDV04_003336 [Boothiomyces sp. JEL0838]